MTSAKGSSMPLGPEISTGTDLHYETCWDCRGYGVVESFGPSVEDCRTCQGGGTVRARDARGRFV